MSYGSDALFVCSLCAVVIRGCEGGSSVSVCCVIVAVQRVASVGSTAVWGASIGFSAWVVPALIGVAVFAFSFRFQIRFGDALC